MIVLPRRTGIASIAILVGIVSAVGIAHAIAPEWSRAAGLDVWKLTDVEADYQESVSRGEELEAIQYRLNQQITASENVVTLLIESRLPLSAASDELCQINSDRNGLVDSLIWTYPETRTVQQRFAQYAMAKARRRLADDPARLNAVMTRLEAEYAKLGDRVTNEAH